MTEQMESSSQSTSLGDSKAVRCCRNWKILVGAFLAVLLLLVAYLAFRFLPVRAVTYDSMEDHFKYGSTGGDLVTGIPFWIWQAMPLVCADTLSSVAGDRLAPDYVQRTATYSSGEDSAAQRRALSREGYKALGFIYERDENGQERDLPIGISQRRSLGLDRVYINCAICHTSTLRKDAQDTGRIVIGMPANTFSLYDVVLSFLKDSGHHFSIVQYIISYKNVLS